MKFAVAAICAVTFLAGCSSIGQRYPFPTGNEASASLQVQGKSLYLLAFDEKGCYTGKTALPPDARSTPIKVVPNQRLVVESDDEIVMTVAFTPRENGRYFLVSVDAPAQTNPDETFFQSFMRGKQRVHIIGVTEMDEATQQLKPVRLTKLSPHQKSFKCIMLS